MPIDYHLWSQSARAELHDVQRKKVELQQAALECDVQIAALIQAINAIAPLTGEEPIQPPGHEDQPAVGMTGCIRAILAQAGEPLSATGIRDRLEAIGFDLQSYSNPLATVHTILKRLSDSAEVETHYDAESPTPKKFSIALSKELAEEKLAGKDFQIGKLKGFIGVGRLRRKNKSPSATQG